MRIRNAIAKLGPAPISELNLSPTAPKHESTGASAERRQRGIASAVHSHEEKKGERDKEYEPEEICIVSGRGVHWSRPR
jgi:hypothetical protein